MLCLPPQPAFMSETCAGKDIDTGERCPCRKYQEQEHPDPNKPIRCRECWHGKSLHPETLEPTQPPKNDLVTQTVMDRMLSQYDSSRYIAACQETNSQLRPSLQAQAGSSSMSTSAKSSRGTSASLKPANEKVRNLFSVYLLQFGLIAYRKSLVKTWRPPLLVLWLSAKSWLCPVV